MIEYDKLIRDKIPEIISPSADGESGGTFAKKSLPTSTENELYSLGSFTDSGKS